MKSNEFNSGGMPSLLMLGQKVFALRVGTATPLLWPGWIDIFPGSPAIKGSESQ